MKGRSPVNEMQKYVATKTLATSDQSFRREAGGALVKVGVAGLGLWVLAGILPFITLPMLLVAAVVFGGFLFIS